MRGTALTIGAMFNPIVATGAFVYGAFQLGSWMYNGKSVEVNIESLIIKP